MGRLADVLSAIDAANAADPTMEQAPDGLQPGALIYGQRMSQILLNFAPSASQALQIAARGQHIERWLRPRAAYPDGRQGYLDWRREAAQFHAARVQSLMLAGGYDKADCEKVSSLMLKKNLKTDPDCQTLEDVACLVFFKWYAGAFASKHDGERVRAIVSKTARKMSAQGRAAALALGLPPELSDALSTP